MKKLSLKNLKLGVNDILLRNQLKTVFGGYTLPGYQCCNAWGCGPCVRGSNEDCSVYGSEVWGRICSMNY